MSLPALVVGSEAALALYPILIKKVPTNLATQVLARILTYSAMAYFLASHQDVVDTWQTGWTRSLGLGAITLTHIGVSYYAFQTLPAGAAISLFYTYPIWNMLGAVLGFGERFSMLDIGLLLVAFVGVVLIAQSLQQTEGFTQKETTWKGIAAGLLSAFTESAMYFAVRTAKQPSPFYAILELYPGALFLLLPLIPLLGVGIELKASTWASMIGFNTLIGFLGYALRFYAIPRLPTLVFSLLTFIGVIASFGWGWLFVQETPPAQTLLGGLMIASAAAFSSSK